MQHENETGENHVHMPLPTAWPFVLALGVTLVVTGMVTNVAISLLGLWAGPWMRSCCGSRSPAAAWIRRLR